MRSNRMSPSLSGWGVAFCGVWLAVALPGCFFGGSSEAPPPPAPVVTQPAVGQLTLRWTVDEMADGNVCIMGQASTIDIVLTATDGQPAGEYQASCGDFSTNMSTLQPGDYVGTARLVDSGGQARTTTLPINQFAIFSGSLLVVDVDFPADSFR